MFKIDFQLNWIDRYFYCSSRSCSHFVSIGSISTSQWKWNESPLYNYKCTRFSIYLKQFKICFFIFILVGGREVIRRACYYANPNESKDSCMHEQVSSSIQREFCEICDTDGCNGASQYGPAILFVIVSAAITKFLSS